MSSETVELAQAHERERIAAETYNQQQTSYRELEALYQSMTERALAAERDAAAWRQAAQRLERQREQARAVNRELNIQSLAWMERAGLLERAARRLVAAWRAERARSQALEDALRTIRDNYGHVCRQFDTCSHVACRDSYSAWHVASDVLAELLNEG